MKLADLPHGRSTAFTVAPLLSERLEAAVDVPLRLFSTGPDDVAVLGAAEDAWPVRGLTAHDERELGRVLDRGRPRVVWATPFRSATEPGALLVQVQELVREHRWTVPVELGVDAALVEALRRSRMVGHNASAAAVAARLTEWFLLPAVDGAPAVCAIATIGRPDDALGPAVFSLHGQSQSADVRREPDGTLLVTRVTRLRRSAGGERDPWCLMQGSISFVDATVEGQLGPSAAVELDALVGGAESYLKRWTEYNAIERRHILDRARSAGSVRYTERHRLANGDWRFFLATGTDTDAIRRLRDGDADELAAVAAIPPALLPGPVPHDPDARPVKEFAGEAVKVDLQALSVDLRADRGIWDERQPPATGHLIVSLVGDETRLRRREQARDAIVTTRPLLGMLLEGRPAPTGRHRVFRRIPPSVLARFPGGKPTDRQLEALRVAMNTPDVAVIQGPPGTGKTDVIAALETWLAEEADAAGAGLAGSVLLTSYQHDAVDNAAGRSTVLDLPALRVGGRRAPDDMDEHAQIWTQQLVTTLKADLDTREGGLLVQQANDIRDHQLMYALSPTPPQETAELLELVAGSAHDVLPSGLRDRLRARARALRASATSLDDDDLARLEDATRSLRTSAIAFSDDGPLMAYKVLARLRDVELDVPEAVGLLTRAAALDPDEPLDDDGLEIVDALAGIRDRLLDLVLERVRHAVPVEPVHDVASRTLLAEAAVAAGNAVRRSPDGVSETLAELRDSLVNDPRAVMTTLGNYTAVLAATCQQSAGRAMALEKDARAEFETVIVDEAARANPLDLMIPLAQAERRIVLVGDHRQLPHVLEPEVERELEQDVAEATRIALRQSLFERLYVDLSERQANRGEPRRVVTLDTQFRMHPVLGDFVSRAFYEPHGTPLRSGRPAEAFRVDLPETGSAVAAWVDVPRSSAGPEQGGTSKSRPQEATWIAARLRAMMESEPTLSFGVISFYRAQVRAIEKALVEVGIMVHTDEGDPMIARRWRLTTDAAGRTIQRLRVGTVDAFQGREFDVVLLSLTRSSPPVRSTEPIALRRRFGHLMLENRLCVAMSRQRRQLIVVGDAELAAGDEGAVAVPSLRTFLEVCDGEHGARVPA